MKFENQRKRENFLFESMTFYLWGYCLDFLNPWNFVTDSWILTLPSDIHIYLVTIFLFIYNFSRLESLFLVFGCKTTKCDFLGFLQENHFERETPLHGNFLGAVHHQWDFPFLIALPKGKEKERKRPLFNREEMTLKWAVFLYSQSHLDSILFLAFGKKLLIHWFLRTVYCSFKFSIKYKIIWFINKL